MALSNTVVANVVGEFKDNISKRAERSFKIFKNVAGGALRKVGLLAAAATVSAGLIFGVAISNAAAFDAQIIETATLMDGVNNKQIAEMKQGVLEIGNEFNQLREKATKAFFDINSAGFTGKQGLDVLDESSKLAVAGVSDVSKTSDLLTSALNAYGKGAESAGKFSDIFFATQQKGKTTISELAASLPNVLPSARLAGQGLEMIGAAVATLTANGISTSESVTALNGLLLGLAAPADAAGKEMARLGIRTKDTHGNMLPLIAIVRQFEGLPVDVIRKLLPDQSAIKAIAVLSGNLATFKSNLDFIKNASGATETGFAKMADTFSFKVDKMTGSIGTLLTKIGTFIVENKNVKIVLDEINKLIDSGSEFIDKNRKAIYEWIKKASEMALENGPKVLAWFQNLIGDTDSLMGRFEMLSNQVIPALTEGFGLLLDFGNGVSSAFDLVASAALKISQGIFKILTPIGKLTDFIGLTKGFSSTNRIAAGAAGAASSDLFNRAISRSGVPRSNNINNGFGILQPAIAGGAPSRSAFGALPLGSTGRLRTTRNPNGISVSSGSTRTTRINVGDIIIQGGNGSSRSIADQVAQRIVRLEDRRF
jgi:TP901 family phage tail tape measure protein